jgi:hypothetical protein
MRPRLGGAALAVLGGVLMAGAAVVPDWWAGPIHIAGKVIHGKTVHLGLWQATGCNAGDGTCMSLDVSLLFRVTGLATLLLSAGTVIASLRLAVASLRRSASEARFAGFALIGSVLAVLTALTYIAVLPGRFEEIAAGYSAYGFFAGTVVVVIASLLALQQQAPERQAPEPVDVRELLSTDMLRPAMLGPEPKLGRYGAVISNEPSHVAPVGPRFRPLYEVEGYSETGPGTGPYAPISGSYPSSPGQYAPMSGSYPSTPGPYAPMSGSYPSTPGPYAPMSGGYPESSGQYPPMSGGYPESSGQYAPISGSYPSSSGQYAPISGSYGAETEAVLDDLRTDAVDALATESSAALEPEAAQQWWVDPPNLPSRTEPLTEQLSEPLSDPGFDQPTMPSQISMAAMMANIASTSDPEPPERSSGRPPAPHPRVPTATTSASMAALAALSKPAVITMAPMIARKLAPPRTGEVTSLDQAPACPNCEEPMGWVEKHRRFYCGTCRVYF